MTTRAEVAPDQSSEQSAKGKDKGQGRRGNFTGFWFVLPFLVAYALFFIWPVLLGLSTSFFDRSLVLSGAGSFLGLANYGELLRDPDFWSSLWHTVLFTILSTPPLVLIALILALLTNRLRYFQWFFRFSFFAPYVLPVSVVTLIWIWLYQPGFGLVNGTLTAIGLPEIGWLTDEGVAMVAVVITTVWWTLGFNFVLYLAGLQEIPQNLYDAAATDGANGWAQTRWITLPLLARTTGLVLVLQILASLKVFDQFILMQPTGGPGFSTRPVLQYVYEQGFTSYRIGYASAMSYAFFLIIIVVSLVWFITANRREGSA
ncbi:sugar ABC transporter permease [soil metagenome]